MNRTSIRLSKGLKETPQECERCAIQSGAQTQKERRTGRLTFLMSASLGSPLAFNTSNLLS